MLNVLDNDTCSPNKVVTQGVKPLYWVIGYDKICNICFTNIQFA